MDQTVRRVDGAESTEIIVGDICANCMAEHTLTLCRLVTRNQLCIQCRNCGGTWAVVDYAYRWIDLVTVHPDTAVDSDDAKEFRDLCVLPPLFGVKVVADQWVAGLGTLISILTGIHAKPS